MPAPAFPTITGLKAPTDTGASARDGLTKHVAPVLAGTVAAGATVTIMTVDGSVVGEATVVGTSWTFALPAAEGTVAYMAVVGAEASEAFTVAIDRTATAPTARLADGVPTDPSGGNPGHAGSTTPTLVGTAEPGAIVQVFRGATAETAVPVGVATADLAGAWSLGVAVDPGAHTFWATAIDRANNKSAKVQVAAIDVDATAPAGVPTLVLTSGQGGIAGPESGLTVAGTAPAAGYVEVLVAGVAVGTAQAAWDGEDFVWAFTVPASALPTISDAQLDVAARLISAHGQRGAAATLQVGWDVDGPAGALTITGLDAAGNLLSNTLSPDLSGTADADVVRVVLRGADGRLIGEAPVTAGSWTFATSADWATAGGETIAVTGYDAAGNASGTASFGLTGDAVAPAMPTVVGFDAPVALAGAAPSNVAGAVIAHLRGAAPGAALVEAYDGQTWLASAPVRLDGSWSLQLPTSIGGGALSIDLIAIDAAGNLSEARPYAFTRDLDTPAAPTLALVGDGRSDDEALATTGPIAFEGTAGPDVARVALVRDDVEVASDVPDAGGAFQLAFSGALPDGEHTFTIALIDRGGNRTDLDRVVIVDAIAPAAPIFPALLESATPDPVLAGRGEGYAWITLSDDGGPIATTQADSTGAWSVAFPGPMPDGTTAFSVAASDAAGNVGASRAGTLVIRAAGTAPVVTSVQGDSDPTAAVLTPLTAPELRGTAEAGSQVVVAWGAQSVATSADAAGTWTVVLALDAGTSTPVTVTGTDRFGHVAATALTVQVAGAQAAPTGPLGFEAASDSGTFGDALTRITTPAFQGVQAPGATVVLLIDGVLVDQETADATTGAWRIAVPTALAEGPHQAQIVLRDAAGGLSQPSAPFAFTIDTTAPALTDVAYDNDTGIGEADGITADATLDLTYAAEHGATVALTVNGQSRPVNAPIALPPNAPATLVLTATDAAGNATSRTHQIVHDDLGAGTTAGLPGFAAGFDNGTPGDGIAYSATGFTFTGTVADAAQVDLYIDGQVVAREITSAYDPLDLDGTLGAGNWSFHVDDLAPGSHTLRVAPRDVAGNPGQTSDTWTFEVVAPLAAAEVGYLFGYDPDGDGYTGSRIVELVGRADAAADAVTIQINGKPSFAVDLTDEANFTLDGGEKVFDFPLPVSMIEGANLITAIAHDDLYARDTASTTTLHLDRTPPGMPVVTGPAVTADPTPVLTGTVSEAGATITVKRGTTVVGTGLSVAGAEGQPATWAVQLTTPLAEGDNALTVQARDRMGFTSPIRTGVVVDLDTSAANRPAIAILAGDTGVSNADGITQSNLIFVGGALNGATAVELYVDGQLYVGAPFYGTPGQWFDAVAVAPGAHVIEVRAVGSGGDGAASRLDVVYDPVAAPITGLALAGAAAIPGTSVVLAPGDDVTLSGFAEPGAAVYVEINDTLRLHGQYTYVGAGTDGAWSHTFTDVADAAYEALVAVSADVAGNTGGPPSALAFVVDTGTTAPTLDAVAAYDANGAGDADADFLLNADRVAFSGDAEAGAKVELLVDGVVTGTLPAAAQDGSWGIGDVALAEGTHVVYVRTTDVGHHVADSAPRVVTIDRSAPAVTAGHLAATSEQGPVAGVTDDDVPTITGQVGAGETVALTGLRFGGTTYPIDAITPTIAPDGTWSATVPLEAFMDGAVEVLGQVFDAAGNAEPTQALVTFTHLDQVGPSGIAGVPRLAEGSDSLAADNLTNVKRPTFEGEVTDSDAGYVAIYARSDLAPDMVLLGYAPIVDGRWSYRPATDLEDSVWGVYASPVTDAGLLGESSLALVFAVDTTAPDAADLTWDFGNLGFGRDRHTNLNTFSIDGDVADHEYGMQVEIEGTASGQAPIVGGATVRTGVLFPGSFNASLDVPFPEGTSSWSVRVKDLAGNLSAPVTHVLTRDTTPPDAPSIDTPQNSRHHLLNAVLTGTSEPFAGIMLFEESTSTYRGSAIADAAGNWSARVEAPYYALPPAGPMTLRAEVRDQAGNAGTANTLITIELEPLEPFVFTGQRDGIYRTTQMAGMHDFAGTGARPGDQVRLNAGFQGTFTTTADGDGDWAFQAVPLSSWGASETTLFLGLETEARNNGFIQVNVDDVVVTGDRHQVAGAVRTVALDPAALAVEDRTPEDDTVYEMDVRSSGLQIYRENDEIPGFSDGDDNLGPFATFTRAELEAGVIMADTTNQQADTFAFVAFAGGGAHSIVETFTLERPPAALVLDDAELRSSAVTPAAVFSGEGAASEATVTAVYDGTPIGATVANEQGEWSLDLTGAFTNNTGDDRDFEVRFESAGAKPASAVVRSDDLIALGPLESTLSLVNGQYVAPMYANQLIQMSDRNIGTTISASMSVYWTAPVNGFLFQDTNDNGWYDDGERLAMQSSGGVFRTTTLLYNHKLMFKADDPSLPGFFGFTASLGGHTTDVPHVFTIHPVTGPALTLDAGTDLRSAAAVPQAVFSGAGAAAHAYVTAYDGDTAIGTVRADQTGHWSLDLTGQFTNGAAVPRDWEPRFESPGVAPVSGRIETDDMIATGTLATTLTEVEGQWVASLSASTVLGLQARGVASLTTAMSKLTVPAGGMLFLDVDGSGHFNAGDTTVADTGGSYVFSTALLADNLMYKSDAGNVGATFTFQASFAGRTMEAAQAVTIDAGPSAYALVDAAASDGTDWCAIALDYDAFAAGPGAFAGPGAAPVVADALLDGDAAAGRLELDALLGAAPTSGERVEEVFGPLPADILVDGEATRRLLEQQQFMTGLAFA